MHIAVTGIRDSDRRMLAITGPAGIGRSAVIQKMVSHCKERKWFLAGIVLLKAGKEVEQIMRGLWREIVTNIRKPLNDA
jgi:nucleoside-triphosphatase THEP1